jgi:hypothetical protein
VSPASFAKRSHCDDEKGVVRTRPRLRRKNKHLGQVGARARDVKGRP